MERILAAGPVIKPKGHLPHRVVLRAFFNEDGQPCEFVVHNQAFNPDGRHSFSDGSYFPFPASTPPAEVMDYFERAYRCWQERDAGKVLILDYDSIFREPAPAAAAI
jgi:hypothetical protein